MNSYSVKHMNKKTFCNFFVIRKNHKKEGTLSEEHSLPPFRTETFHFSICFRYTSAASTQPSTPTSPLSRHRWWFSAMPHF